jgi:hypothetical protein
MKTLSAFHGVASILDVDSLTICDARSFAVGKGSSWILNQGKRLMVAATRQKKYWYR